MTADEALGALVGTLEQLRQIFPKDKATWDSRSADQSRRAIRCGTRSHRCPRAAARPAAVTGATGLEWTVDDAYMVVYASLPIAGGVLGDRRGRKWPVPDRRRDLRARSLVCGLAPSIRCCSLAGCCAAGARQPDHHPVRLREPAAAGRGDRAVVHRVGSGVGGRPPPVGGVLVDALGCRRNSPCRCGCRGELNLDPPAEWVFRRVS